jgi:hypothetical protein
LRDPGQEQIELIEWGDAEEWISVAIEIDISLVMTRM